MNSKPVLSLHDVKTIAIAAEAEALRNAWAVTIAIVDDGGHLLWLQRLDGAAPVSAHIAPGKACTAAMGRRESRVYEETINQGRVSFLSAPGLGALLEGGVPILVEGQCVGAVGVSGVKSTEDVQIARAGHRSTRPLMALGYNRQVYPQPSAPSETFAVFGTGTVRFRGREAGVSPRSLVSPGADSQAVFGTESPHGPRRGRLGVFSRGPPGAKRRRARATRKTPVPAPLLKPQSPAILALADGTVFHGVSIGAEGRMVGEVVFNTAMTGYQEILTDPSYCRQIVTLTYPHIGNYGVNAEDVEARKVHVAGLVIRDLPVLESNFRMSMTLAQYLQREGVVAIADIDTRRLTRLLRTQGAQNGCLLALPSGEAVSARHADEAVGLARSAPSMAGLDLAREVSGREPFDWTESEWALGRGYGRLKDAAFHVVAYDFGVKHNILRMLASRGCRVTVVPAQTTAAQAVALRPDGIFLSNGPGDPQPCDYAIAATRELMDRGMPTFGICLGHQIMALACGARTFKMKFGHHGANHPVKDLDTGRVSITSQNHGFAVDEKSLPANLRATHVSLFDGSLQGLARTDRPAFCFQGHPEASPGPHDIAYLFDRFTALMESSRSAQAGSRHA